MNHLSVTDIYSILQPPMAEHSFFSSAHGIFTKIGLHTGHKQFKSIKIINSVFFDHNITKLEMKYLRKPQISEKQITQF